MKGINLQEEIWGLRYTRAGKSKCKIWGQIPSTPLRTGSKLDKSSMKRSEGETVKERKNRGVKPFLRIGDLGKRRHGEMTASQMITPYI